MLALRACALHAGGHALADEGALKLGKSGLNGEYQLALGRRPVEQHTLADPLPQRGFIGIDRLPEPLHPEAQTSVINALSKVGGDARGG